MSSSPQSPKPATPADNPRWWTRPRWRWAGGCFLLGVTYTALAMLYGFELRLGGRDVSLVAGALLEMSFAVLGYLLGMTSEARQREKAAARENDLRLRQLADLRIRLAQTEKLASLGQLAGAVAHEVRNPLAIVRTMVQNLAEELENHPASRGACADILEEVDRLARVTSRLVDFARPLRAEITEMPMVDLAQRLRLLTEAKLRDSALRLNLEGDEHLRWRGDPDLICQVLLGLVGNAAQASPPHGTITVGWHHDARGQMIFSVSDEGPGVPSELRREIFEPFFTTRDDGHGLGLAVARQMVEAHGGTISVEGRAPSPGACFRIELPQTMVDAA